MAEHKAGVVSNGTLSAVAAAKQLGGDITLLVCGESASKVAEMLKGIRDVKKVGLSMCWVFYPGCP